MYARRGDGGLRTEPRLLFMYVYVGMQPSSRRQDTGGIIWANGASAHWSHLGGREGHDSMTHASARS